MKTKRKNSQFRTAPDGRLIIDADEEENNEQYLDDDDDDEEEMNREDLKGLMETLSLSQRAKNKRKRAFESDDDDDDDDGEYQINDKQSHKSKYQSKL